MKRIIALLWLVIGTATIVFGQERVKRVLELKNGTTITGYVMEQGNGSYMLETAEGDILFFSREEVRRITETSQSSSTPSVRSQGSHIPVDLGLSVKWASCNVGASTPSESGDYFAWGETSPKSYYDWDNYKWYDNNGKALTKYNSINERGTVDNKKGLDLSDDAANVIWGGQWRIPTWEEWEELLKGCRWKWTSLDGVKGYVVTSKKNGNSIFLPAVGYYEESSVHRNKSLGRYWSSSVYVGYPSSAQFLLINMTSKKNDTNNRCYGLSVRPVIM